MKHLSAMQNETTETGRLQINVTSSANSYPVADAQIAISYTGVPENTLEMLTTDSSGQTETIELGAPPEEWSLNPDNERQPYSEYTLDISAPGFEPVSISGAEILANTKAIQNVRMRPSDTGKGRGRSMRSSLPILYTASIRRRSQRMKSSRPTRRERLS